MMKERYSEMIEALTGRKVLAFLSQASVPTSPSRCS
jgi:hypothetical protein